MNLLGGAFKYEHIKFNPLGEAAKIWDGIFIWIGCTTHCFSLRSKGVREGFLWREVVFF